VAATTGGVEDSEMSATLTPIVAHLPAIVTTLTAANPGAAERIARGPPARSSACTTSSS
jgi:hypothetical protein